jgi:hypothetical protein
MFLLFIFINTTYIIKFSIYLCSKFFWSCRATFCFTNPDDPSLPQLLWMSDYFYQTTRRHIQQYKVRAVLCRVFFPLHRGHVIDSPGSCLQ